MQYSINIPIFFTRLIQNIRRFNKSGALALLSSRALELKKFLLFSTLCESERISPARVPGSVSIKPLRTERELMSPSGSFTGR
jgi:hypothetical protein